MVNKKIRFENNNTVLVLILLSLAAGALIGYYYPREKETPNANIQSPSILNPNPTISVTTVSQKDSMFDINAQYPQFSLVDPAFNTKIATLINEKINTFKKNSTENWQARKETATPEEKLGENPETPFYFKADWSPAQINKNYISFVVNIYSFSGGAHGDSEVYTFNYNLATKKEVRFSEFIANSQENLSIISKLAVEDLVSQRGNYGETNAADIKKELEDGGAGPNMDNFNNFTFDDSIITIYYQKYQVGPGVLGIVKTIFQKNYLLDQKIKSEYLK